MVAIIRTENKETKQKLVLSFLQQKQQTSVLSCNTTRVLQIRDVACHSSFSSSGAAEARLSTCIIPMFSCILSRISAATCFVNVGGIPTPQYFYQVNTAVADFLLYPEVLDIKMSYLSQSAPARYPNGCACVAVHADSHVESQIVGNALHAKASGYAF